MKYNFNNMKFKLLGTIWITAMTFSSFSTSFSESIIERIDIPPTKQSASIKASLNSKQAPILEENIYLVIGVFALKSNAEKFTKYANESGYPAKYSLNNINNYFYVYLHSTNDIELSKAEYEKVTSSTNIFPGIWLFKFRSQSAEQEVVVAEELEIEDQPSIEKILEMPQPTSSSKTLKLNVDDTELIKKENEYLIYPNVVFGRNFKEINAKVQVIDPVRSKLLKTVNAHELSVVQDPNNGSHSIQLIADVFGYRKVQHDFVLNGLDADSVSSYIFLRGDTILVEFPMERLKTGDVATMYNVFFRNDAVVMESSSQYELNSLMEMLRENENYTIVIHGHTNGNKSGKIIKLAEENPNFFVITEDNKSGSGSAKKLSTERALTIKKYLVSNGIDGERMKVEGWGGKKMIYDKYSVDAKKNVRVEIEILQD